MLAAATLTLMCLNIPLPPSVRQAPRVPLGPEDLWVPKAFPDREVLPVCKAPRGSPARLALRGQ